MSHYSEVDIEIRDRGCLMRALARLWGTDIEVYDEPQHLYGYKGDVRNEKAHIIIRRKHLHSASNDIGFEVMADGKIVARVSEFDQYLKFDKRIKQAYGVEKATAEAKRRGYRVTETKEAGKIKLSLRR